MFQRWTGFVLTFGLLACSTTTSNLRTGMSPAELPGFPQDYDRVFSAALDAAATLSWEVTVAERDAGIIAAKTPMSLATYGDKVTIRVFRPDSTRGDSLTRVGFTSATDQAVDWGQNSRNQKNFYKRLRGLLKGMTTSADSSEAHWAPATPSAP
jgi:hypothetical protein